VNNIKNAMLIAVIFCMAVLMFFPLAHAETRMSIDDCISLAMRQSPVLKGETERLNQAKSEYLMARSALLPKLSATASFTRLNGDRLSFGSMPVELHEQEGFAGISARQLLFDAGRKKYASEAAKKAIEAVEFEKTGILDDIVFLVTQAFLNLLETQELLKVSEQAVLRQQDFEAMSKVFFDAGKVTRLDVLKAQAQRAQAENEVNKVRGALRLATALLKQTIGIDVSEQINFTGMLPDSVAPAPDASVLLNQAQEHSPVIRQLASMVSLQEAEVRSAKGAFWPELELQGTYGFRDRDTGGCADEWTVGLMASWSLFDSGFNRANEARVTAKQQEATHQLEAARLKLQVAMEKAIVAWQTACDDFASASDLVKANNEALETAQALYAAGKAVALDVLTAQTELSRSEQQMVSAIYEYEVARAEVKRLTGTES